MHCEAQVHIKCFREGGVQAATKTGRSIKHGTLNLTVNLFAGVDQSHVYVEFVELNPTCTHPRHYIRTSLPTI
jgi:hypothetical protein